MANNNKLPTQRCEPCKGTGKVPVSDKAGPLLCTLREAAGISRPDMADRLGISRAFLYDLELGNRTWTTGLAVRYQEELEKEAVTAQ